MRFAILAVTLIGLVTASFLIWGEPLSAWMVVLVEAAPSRVVAALVIFALLAADIALPVPSSIVIVLAGAILGPVEGAIAAACGLTAGALAGFVAAREFGATHVRRWIGEREFVAISALLQRHNGLVLTLLRPVPVLSETSVLIAGAMGLPIGKTLLFVVLANAGVCTFYAVLGAAADDPYLLFAAACAPALVFWGLARAAGLRTRP